MKKVLLLFICFFLFIIKVEAIETSGDGVILMDQDSGRILYGKNINKQKLIASTTKNNDSSNCDRIKSIR